MKSFLTALPALFFSLCLAAQPATDILHYQFALELSDKHDTLYGTTTITLITRKAGNSVSLDLQGTDAKGKGMKVTKTVFPFVENGNDNAPVSTFTHQQNKLTINALQPFKSGDTLQVLIRYKGVPENGMIISKTMYGRRTFFGDNWPNRAHH